MNSLHNSHGPLFTSHATSILFSADMDPSQIGIDRRVSVWTTLGTYDIYSADHKLQYSVVRGPPEVCDDVGIRDMRVKNTIK